MSDRPVAYLLKGWPRLSELFIASEIWRLEQLGVDINLYVLKPRDEEVGHPIVDQLRTVPDYLPATTPLTDTPLPRWMRRNIRPFAGALCRMTVRHPLGMTRAAGAAFAQSVRARRGWRLKRIYAKELLQAVELVDRLSKTPEVRHIHAHFAHGTTTVAWLACKIAGHTFSFTGHAKDIYQPGLNPAGLLARKMRAATFVTTCTGANGEHLRAIEPRARIHTVEHGLNAEFCRLLTGAAPVVAPPTFRVVSVGRHVRKKGFDTLIKAAALLRDGGRSVEVRIIGEPGEATNDLRELIFELGLRDCVSVSGAMSQADLLAEYRTSSAFALACRILDDGDRDGIPNVLVEALAAGLPAVSTRISGIPELIIDGETGLLVDPDDPTALATALERLIDDAALRTRLADEGRRRVDVMFDGDTLARRLASLFDEVAR